MVEGERVRALRLGRGLSVEGLAIQAGMTRDGVHKIETGRRSDVAARSVVGLARALHTSADYLLALTDDPAPRAGEVVAFVPRPELVPLVQQLNGLPEPRRQQVSQILSSVLALLD